jgi:ABC-type antimicrobial peptide transport system permease subunit
MVIERFSQGLVNSGIFKVYIATGFFASLIFFTLNAELFTPLEMLFGIIFITLVLKALSNVMLSLIISLFSLDNKREEFEFKYNEDKIQALLNELVIKEVSDSNDKEQK